MTSKTTEIIARRIPPKKHHSVHLFSMQRSTGARQKLSSRGVVSAAPRTQNSSAQQHLSSESKVSSGVPFVRAGAQTSAVLNMTTKVAL